MSDTEKTAIMEQLSSLPEADKAFLLGYAAGRAAAPAEDKEKPEKEQHTESA